MKTLSLYFIHFPIKWRSVSALTLRPLIHFWTLDLFFFPLHLSEGEWHLWKLELMACTVSEKWAVLLLWAHLPSPWNSWKAVNMWEAGCRQTGPGLEIDRGCVYYGPELLWQVEVSSDGVLASLAVRASCLVLQCFILILSCHGVLTRLSDETGRHTPHPLPCSLLVFKTQPIFVTLSDFHWFELSRLNEICAPAPCQICHLSVFSVSEAKPQWIQTMKDTALAIEERLYWECRASGKPKPSYMWLRNGQQLLSEVNYKSSSASGHCFIFKSLIFSLSSSFHFREAGIKHVAVS